VGIKIKHNDSVKIEAMEKKIRIILERARDGVEPLEDLEQELLNLHIVIEWLSIEKEVPKEGQMIRYKGNFDDGVLATFLFFDGNVGWAKPENGKPDCFEEWITATR
jgi:hypothetical protein